MIWRWERFLNRWSPWRVKAELDRLRQQHIEFASYMTDHRHDFYEAGPIRVYPYIQVVVAELPIGIHDYRKLMGLLDDRDYIHYETPLFRVADDDIRVGEGWLLIDAYAGGEERP